MKTVIHVYATSICFLADTLKNNSLEEVSAEFILTDKVDTSQLSAQEAVIKSAKLGKNGRLGQKKKICVFTVCWPTLIFYPDTKLFNGTFSRKLLGRVKM